jgi:hypothetical protein
MGAASAQCGKDVEKRHFVVGGQHAEFELTDNQATLSEYLSRPGRWVNRRPMPNPTGHISSSVLPYGCGILVLGGVRNGEKLTSDIWWYSASEDDWHMIGELPVVAKTPICDIAWSTLICVVEKNVYTAQLGFTLPA